MLTSLRQLFHKKPQEKKKPFGKERFISEAKSIFVIFIVVFALRSVFFEPFRIPSGSMIPTLMIGDFILVNKFAYGVKVPFSDMYSDPIYVFHRSDPKRGEVIVFKYPKDENINYIKRVVGLPGDQIEVVDRVLYVNSRPIEGVILSHDEEELLRNDLEMKFKPYNLRFSKTKTGSYEHIIASWEDSYHTRDFFPVVVPKGKYFVMGDNRDLSSDSRMWGWVDHRLIKGKASLVWFSFNTPDPQQGHEMKFRPWRMGRSIH